MTKKQKNLTNYQQNIVKAINPHRIVNLTELSHKIGSTYSHMIKMIERLEEMRIVKTFKHGRERSVQLTFKGVRVKALLLELEEVLG